MIDALKLTRPVLTGHSLGGEELSSVGSRHSEKVAGLVYLDAGYGYAFYDRAHGDLTIDLLELRKKLDEFMPGKAPWDPTLLVKELVETYMPSFERDLHDLQKRLQTTPPPTAQAPPQPPAHIAAILAGQQKYSNIPVPILAIFALPHGPPAAQDDASAQSRQANDLAVTGIQAKAFEDGLPSARVVRLPILGPCILP